MSFTISVTIAGIKEFEVRLRTLGATLIKKITDLIVLTAYAIEAEAKRAVPVRSGRLRGSITTTIDAAGNVKVGTNVQYASFVEQGTKPHLVLGRPVMSWLQGSLRMWSRRVRHPGTMPKPYLMPAFAKHSARFKLRVETILNEVAA